MLRSEAAVQTRAAERYIAQLAKHFAHKIEVEIAADTAVLCRFPCGTAGLTASADTLTIAIESTDAQGRKETEVVIESHLRRFAFREDLGPIDWQVR